MDKELFRKTEGKLYRYYKYKMDIKRISSNIELLENKKAKIEEDIKSTNVNIDYYQNGIGINERVQSSNTGTSYAEAEMCKQIEKLEREHVLVVKRIFKNKARIRELESFINNMERNIEMLNEEDKRFIELKYGDKKNILQISLKMNMAQMTAYRKRDEIIKAIAEYDNLLFGKVVKK